MKLALRSTPSASGNWLARAAAAVTRWRLCSQYCHGGIVIGDRLLHATSKDGLHATTDWEPAKWTLIDLGHLRDATALSLFDRRIGAPYDWLGVFGFALPWVRGRRHALYCFEWCALALGAKPARWMTPERLLAHIAARRFVS